MFSRWIVTNTTSARGTVHCRKKRIPCGDQLVICGLYKMRLQASGTVYEEAREGASSSPSSSVFYCYHHSAITPCSSITARSVP
jgi:hypothetical protein